MVLECCESATNQAIVTDMDSSHSNRFRNTIEVAQLRNQELHSQLYALLSPSKPTTGRFYGVTEPINASPKKPLDQRTRSKRSPAFGAAATRRDSTRSAGDTPGDQCSDPQQRDKHAQSAAPGASSGRKHGLRLAASRSDSRRPAAVKRKQEHVADELSSTAGNGDAAGTPPHKHQELLPPSLSTPWEAATDDVDMRKHHQQLHAASSYMSVTCPGGLTERSLTLAEAYVTEEEQNKDLRRQVAELEHLLMQQQHREQQQAELLEFSNAEVQKLQQALRAKDDSIKVTD